MGLAAPDFSGNTVQWELHRLDDGTAGLRSPVSRRWLGQGVLGHIRARANQFGPWEQWEVPEHRDGPILCCSANSYAGGWLHVTLDPKTGAARFRARTASLKDKHAAAVWRVVPLAPCPAPR